MYLYTITPCGAPYEEPSRIVMGRCGKVDDFEEYLAAEGYHFNRRLVSYEEAEALHRSDAELERLAEIARGFAKQQGWVR